MSSIKVFQDLRLSGDHGAREELARALIGSARPPWTFDERLSRDAEQNVAGDRGILIFERSGEPGSAAKLILWPNDGGFYVPNVLPIGITELTVEQYNNVVSDFHRSIALPAARSTGFHVEVTKAEQGPDAWFGEPAAEALRRFSAAANKSTGANHPLDQQRWFDFIIAAHRARAQGESDLLARWLHESEGWSDAASHELAAQYERGRGLLSRGAESS